MASSMQFICAQTQKGWKSFLKGDIETAISRFEKKAMDGDTDAAFVTGMLYLDDYFETYNIEQATKWLKLASDKGSGQASYNLFVLNYDQVLAETAATTKGYLEKSAEQNLAQAHIFLSLLYSKSNPVLGNEEPIFTKVAEHSLKAYELEETPLTHFLVGSLYAFNDKFGFGVKQDIDLGIAHLEKAFEGGFIAAAIALHDIYSKGEVMDKNKSKAPKWMSKKDPVSDSLESYKSKLKKHLSKKEFESVSEALDKGATIRVNTTPGKVKATVLKDLDSNDPKAIRERIRAERILRTGSANYFTQFRNRNNVFTETEFNNLPGNRKPQLLLEAAPTKNKLGGVLKFRAGKNLPWNNVSWNPNLTPPGNSFISNPSLLYPNTNSEILEGSFSQKPETESSETKPVNTYTPSIHSSYNGFYRK